MYTCTTLHTKPSSSSSARTIGEAFRRRLRRNDDIHVHGERRMTKLAAERALRSEPRVCCSMDQTFQPFPSRRQSTNPPIMPCPFRSSHVQMVAAQSQRTRASFVNHQRPIRKRKRVLVSSLVVDGQQREKRKEEREVTRIRRPMDSSSSHVTLPQQDII